MPELPEVETTLRGILPHVLGRFVTAMAIRNPRLRYPVDSDLPQRLVGGRVDTITRRGKYLLLGIAGGHLLIHLGMSGSLRVVDSGTAPEIHDHVDLVLSSGLTLRYTDPRRFGLWLWHEGEPVQHFLLRSQGPEPLESEFTATYLWKRSRTKTVPIKSFVMDSKVVVGVGNIYANEALHLAGIHPLRQAGRISLPRYENLHNTIRRVLDGAIAQGGTTLRDFVGGDGKPGYFSQSLKVYGRGGQPCYGCGRALKEIRLGQRSTVYCSHCQR